MPHKISLFCSVNSVDKKHLIQESKANNKATTGAHTIISYEEILMPKNNNLQS